MPFVQRYNGHEYILVPVFQASMLTDDVLEGAYVYTRQGKCKGYWPIHNMLGSIADNLRAWAANHPNYCVTERIETLKRGWVDEDQSVR